MSEARCAESVCATVAPGDEHGQRLYGGLPPWQDPPGRRKLNGDAEHAGELFSLPTTKRHLRSAKVRLYVMWWSGPSPPYSELRGDKSRTSHGRMWSGERLSMRFTKARLDFATVSPVKHKAWGFFLNIWQNCGVMGAQVETTHQYSSTFIVLPAQWKLALKGASLIIKRLWTSCWL